MWSTTVLSVTNITKTITFSVSLRLHRYIHSVSRDSYLHNPGSEPLTHATLGDVIEQTVNKYPNRVAVKSIHEDLSLTYEQLLIQADSLGCALREQGLEKGDRVGIWSHNNAAWVVALVAAARVGLVSVAINPVYEKEELRFCIKKSGLKSLLIGESLPNRNYYNLVSQLIPELQNTRSGKLLKSQEFPNLCSIITAGRESLAGTFTYDSLVNNHSNRDVFKYSKDIKVTDGSIIHFTSGTTGDPKAALDSHLGVVNNTYFTGKRNLFHIGHHKICVQVPIFHALGSIITILGALRHGSTLVLAAPFYSVSANMKAIISERCTAITGTPTMFVDLLAEARSKGTAPTTLVVAVAAGAPCSPQLIRDIQNDLNVEKVFALYGMTEATACIFQSLPGDTIDQVAETVGYIQDHTEVKVVDEKGAIVPFGHPGELLSRGYGTMIGYWDDPEKTKNTIDVDGWLHTGDKFTITEDGYGCIVGRIKEIIVRGGENIAPKEIEDLLNTHPDIIESQVVGVADDRLGEELCAVVRLRAGAALSPEDVARFCGGRLARFKIPRLLRVADQFPKTASGKIQKYKLRDLIESGKL